MLRRIAAVIAATAMLLVLAVPAMAGGWAEIVADAETAKTPTEDTPTEIGFTVLQHGKTPAPWESATVHFTDAGTGEAFDVVAKNDRPDGHFVANATLPHAGYWSWQVTLKDLESQHVPVRMTVLTASGALPPFDPTSILSAVDRAKMDVTNSMSERFFVDIERLDRNGEGYRARLDNLAAQTKDLTAQRDALAARVDALEGVGGLPLIAVISLSVLAGSAAGFAMAWLAGRKPPQEVPAVAPLNPAQRGADPV
jgi:hypothetical protein